MVLGLSKLLHYYRKLKTVGVSRCARAMHHRLQRAIFITQMRRKGGRDVGRVPGVASISSRSLHFLDEIAEKCDRKRLISLADQYVAGQFDPLGSEKQLFEKMPWHCDIRLSARDPHAPSLFDANQFYADISIKEGHGDKICKDIKVPWELSRFHHLPVLGLAYALTEDARYAQVAKKQITDWIQVNPYLYGVNWVSPMEVAIRATNWIIAWYWLGRVWQDDEQYSQQLIQSLEDHTRYLEGNWEFYDGRTSNHYLSNLVGYFYLCWFFQGEPETTRKRDWCYQEILRELDWQIFDEGTSYEGSTRYHQLVTELMIHAFLLAREMGIVVEDSRLQKVERMLAFIDWCKPTADGQMVIIGDDDSGSLLHKDLFGLSTIASILFPERGTFFGVKRYAQFGLSISKADDWHITLRHHAYERRQPSAHFHSDVGSVTIAYKGVPIIIDPGSYLYTASREWRNQFRSAAMHNVCYLPGYQRDQKELFALDMDESWYKDVCQTGGVLRTHHIIASDIHLEREVVIDEQKCVITDWLTSRVLGKPQAMKNFTLSPTITVCKEDGVGWLLLHNQKPLLRLLVPPRDSLMIEDTWMSPGYGRRVRTICLKVSQIDGEPTILRVID